MITYFNHVQEGSSRLLGHKLLKIDVSDSLVLLKRKNRLLSQGTNPGPLNYVVIYVCV